jgi:phenylalanyl-tRNA synthetase beta chain
LALKTDDLVIADSKGPLALAGVMGGIASGVSATTKDVLLESAYFDAPRIRKAARTHGLQTDSSYRFERGVDPSGVLTASSRAADLILQVAGGDLAPYAVRVGTPLPTSHEVELSPARCRALLGLNLADSEIRTLLENLGFECLASDAEVQRWNVPSSRADLTRDVDLIEEVIRLAGIERVVGRIRAVPSASSMADAAYDEMMSVRHFLAGAGFSEARTSTLVSRTSGAGRPVLEVRNPLGDDQSALRPTLLSGLLGAVGRNLNQGAASVRLFEIGRVFTVSHEEEQTMVGLVSTGFRSTKSWIESSESAIDMYDLKGVLEKLAPGSSFAAVEAVAPFAAAYQIQTGGFVVGLLGILSPAAAREMNARGPVVAAEIRLDAIASSASVTSAFQPLAKFPAVTRDLALVVPKSTSWGEIEAVVKGTDEPLLTDVRVFDVFADPTGEKLAADRKSLAFSLTFRAAERTLTSDEVSAVFDRIKARVKSALPVEFRE